MIQWLLVYMIISITFGWYNEYVYDINRDMGKHNWFMISIFYVLICWLIIPLYTGIRLRRWFYRGY